MPKKLPLFWPEDANCNKLTSKPLRVLRDRPNKLNSRPRTIPTICDSYSKTKHFKSEKKKNFRSVEEFHGFLTSETILSRHSKNRQRPGQILQANETQQSKTLQSLNTNTAWKKKYSNTMAVDFDHMYIECGDSKISIGRDIEFQHLKELNLLHLDLIQQQAEQLISKDKIIKALKEENKNLRARLERIDRRVSLSLHKKSNELSPISVQTDFANDVSFPFSVKSEGSPRSAGQKSPAARSPPLRNSYEKSPLLRGTGIREEDLTPTDTHTSKRDSLRKLSPRQIVNNFALSPIPQVPPRVSPRDKRAKKEATQSIGGDVSLATNTDQPPSSLSPLCFDSKKTRSPTNKRTLIEDAALPPKKNKNVESPDGDSRPLLSPVEDEGITNHSLRSRNKSKDSHEETLQNHLAKIDTVIVVPSERDSSIHKEEKQSLTSSSFNNSVPIDSEKWKQGFKGGVEARKVRGKGILTTTDSYYLPSHSSGNLLEISGNEELTQVEIPKWRIKVLTSLYVMEGTENLEDEVFIKRHGKPEQDERRRKRWDLQRMREQRQYEKLLERYQGRNNPNGSASGNQQTLWPKPESAQTLQIDPLLPVCAFGQPLAQIPESDFFVPWLVGKLPLQVGLSTRRKKR